MQHHFTVTGMSCGHCEKAATHAIQAIDPNAQIRIARDQQHVEVDSTQPREQLVHAIAQEGYAVAP